MWFFLTDMFIVNMKHIGLDEMIELTDGLEVIFHIKGWCRLGLFVKQLRCCKYTL